MKKELVKNENPKIFRNLKSFAKELEKFHAKKIVYTGGVFDLFHYGHLNYLERAKALGDILIVSIDSDTFVDWKKRVGGVFVSEDKRAFVVSQLQFVDYVVISDKGVYNKELIATVRPNVLVRVVRKGVTNEEREEKRRKIENEYPTTKVVFLEPTGTDVISLIDDTDVLTQTENVLKTKAVDISKFGYSYSGFKVGAVVIDNNNKLHSGCNIVNSTPALTICAERHAIQNAIAGGAKYIKKLVLYSLGQKIVSPCGSCRQVIYEFSDPKSPTEIILACDSDQVVKTNIMELLPMPFESLKKPK